MTTQIDLSTGLEPIRKTILETLEPYLTPEDKQAVEKLTTNSLSRLVFCSSLSYAHEFPTLSIAFSKNIKKDTPYIEEFNIDFLFDKPLTIYPNNTLNLRETIRKFTDFVNAVEKLEALLTPTTFVVHLTTKEKYEESRQKLEEYVKTNNEINGKKVFARKQNLGLTNEAPFSQMNLLRKSTYMVKKGTCSYQIETQPHYTLGDEWASKVTIERI